METRAIYVDIDDTLVRSVGNKRIPIPATVALVRELHRAGASLYAWSTAGGEYARAAATELGIEDCFVAYLPKPRALIDDREFVDWKVAEIHPAQCSSTSAEEFFARLR